MQHLMTPQEPSPPITELLNRAAAGDARGSEQLLETVYGQLRQIAAAQMRQERPGHTLQATALVHEAYAKLLGSEPVEWKGRAQFYFAAAQSMRRVLIDHARARARVKRGGGVERQRVEIGAVADLAQNADPSDVIALEEALCRLEETRPRVAQVITLRFFAGLSVAATAEILGVSPRTVELDWAFARAWLYKRLSSDR